VIEASTADVEIQYVLEEDDEGALILELRGTLANPHVTAVRDPECDVLVLQRPAHKHLAEVIPLVQEYGTAVVCEYDDDFDNVHPRNPAWRAYHPEFSPMSNRVWAKLASQLADLVTVTTPSLVKRYGAHGKVAVLPNYVPEAYLHTKPDPDLVRARIMVGWAGSPHTHYGDLEVMGRPLPALLTGGPSRGFRAIGDEGTLSAVGLLATDGPGIEEIPWVPIEDYPATLASLDVGLAPLADTTFNRSKSWLKALEMAALGVPFVASPTQQYKALAKLGAGDLVGTTTKNRGAWLRALEPLMADSELRQRRAEEGREAASSLTYERHAEEWLVAWTNALSVRRAR
jgi:glycosyltransferase involved in cell wall biosynthesis